MRLTKKSNSINKSVIITDALFIIERSKNRKNATERPFKNRGGFTINSEKKKVELKRCEQFSTLMYLF